MHGLQTGTLLQVQKEEMVTKWKESLKKTRRIAGHLTESMGYSLPNFALTFVQEDWLQKTKQTLEK